MELDYVGKCEENELENQVEIYSTEITEQSIFYEEAEWNLKKSKPIMRLGSS